MGERERGDPRSDEQKRADARIEADRREEAALRSRLDKLSAELDADKTSNAGDGENLAPSDASLGGAMNLGMRALGEFVVTVAVGAVIGWQLDKWFGVAPLFLMVFLLLGTAAGLWSVYRIAAKPPSARR